MVVCVLSCLSKIFISTFVLGFVAERLILSIVSFFGFMNLYLVRHSFSIISVSMIASPNDACSNGNCTSDFEETNQFNWDERTRAIVLSSFFYGYSFTQVIGGRLAELYGTKIVFGSSILLPSFLGFLMPKGAEISYWCLAGLRFLQGVLQGMSWPAMQAILGVWIPPHERSRFTGTVFFAASLSMVVVMPFSGYLCDVYSWQVAFYIVSTLPIIWFIFWFFLVFRSPSLHPRITKKERDYIEKCVQEGGSSQVVMKDVPWKSIFTSLPFLAIIVCDVCNSIGFALFSSQMPNFLKHTFHYQLTKTGFLSGLPFLCRYIGAVLFCFIADYIIVRKILKIATTRRIFSAIAMLLPALSLIFIVSFGMKVMTVFISLCCIYMFFNGSIAASKLTNISDIAPNYAGTLFGISNTMSSIVSFLFIMGSGEILNKDTSIDNWKIVFGSCIPILILGEIFYLVFLRGSPQPWNFFKQKEDKKLDQQQESSAI